MAKTKFFAVDANGAEHTRNSARVYTHCVVARRSKATALRDANTYLNTDYSFYKAYADGASIYMTRGVRETEEQYKSRVAEEVARAVENLRGATSEAEFVEIHRKEALARAENYNYEVYHNLGWCGRADLAAKLAAGASSYYCDVQILPAQSR